MLHNQKIQGGVIVIVKKINKKNIVSDNVKKQLQNEIKFGLRSKTKLKKYANEFKIFFKNFKKIQEKILKKYFLYRCKILPLS